jgi:hypothetical protein
MKLFVQARKDGYHILYPKPTPPEFSKFAKDIRPSGNNLNLLGKYVYTLAFANQGCIFTKHVIIQDLQREGLGNISFSVFIPNDKRLSGSNIIKLLDELSNTYCAKYCSDYCLGNTSEDWEIFETIINQYELDNCSHEENDKYLISTTEEAFIYYNDTNDLQKYFDDPNRIEYNPFKQIYFIEKHLEKEIENPLNAIVNNANVNLTDKIDLLNIKYTLLYDTKPTSGINIEVRVNKIVRNNKKTIRKNEELSIIWSKRYFEPLRKEGSLEKLKEGGFIDINEDQEKVTVYEQQLDEIEYNITTISQDCKGIQIDNPTIRLKEINGRWIRDVQSPTFTITDEELDKGLEVYSIHGKQESNRIQIKNNNKDEIIHLTFSEKKQLKILVKDQQGKDVQNPDIKAISGDKVKSFKKGVFVFIDAEIQDEWNIHIKVNGYKEIKGPFTPAAVQSELEYKLEKENDKTVKGDISNQGADKSPPLIKNPTVLVFIIVTGGLMVFFLIFYLLFNYNNNSAKKTDILFSETIIKDYINGTIINKDTLEKYKKEYCNVSFETKKSSEINEIWETFFLNSNNDKSNDNALYKTKDELCKKLDDLISFRDNINYGNINGLLSHDYDEQHKVIKNAVTGIERKYIKNISDTLKKLEVSKMNLNEIAELIKETQNQLKLKENNINNQLVNNVDTNQIIEHSMGAAKSFDEKTSKNGSTVYSKNIAGSDLEQEFWALVNSGNVIKQKYHELSRKYNNSNQRNNPIAKYLEKICTNSDSFNQFKNIDEVDRKNTKNLNDLKVD